MKGSIIMARKYTLTEESCIVRNKTLYRIKAEKDFGNVKKGDLGGFIEKEANLSHTGKAWVYDNAQVFDNAQVLDNACIYNNACIQNSARVFGEASVYDNATISDRARVYDNAQVRNKAKIYNSARVSGEARIYDNVDIFGHSNVFGNAVIYDNARIYDRAAIYGNAHIYDRADVYGDTHISDNARIYGNAHVYGDTNIYGNAYIFESANVFGNAIVFGDARVCELANVQYSRLNTDLREDLKASLRCQCNLIPENDKVIAYKVVHKNLHSLYTEKFVYEIGKIAVCENPAENNASCAAGLHFSNLTYWDNEATERFDNLVYLKAEIDLKDIITVQCGKIRCRKAKILSKIDIF
jgi:carbonic anhydrase/acetyltransferase-like protein (isoleucine patch superfamily)